MSLIVSGSECGCASTFDTTGMRGTTISVDASASLGHNTTAQTSFSPKKEIIRHLTRTPSHDNAAKGQMVMVHLSVSSAGFM